MIEGGWPSRKNPEDQINKKADDQKNDRTSKKPLDQMVLFLT